MKRTIRLLVTLIGAPLVQAAFNLNVPVNQAIPDGALAGLASVATVTNLPGLMQDLVVTMNISGTYNGDLYAHLTHGAGFSVLLNRPGRTATDPLGYGDAGLNVRLSDAAAVDIHFYGGNGGHLLTGTYQPDGRSVFPTDVLNTTPRSAMLSSFNGLDPNGEWVMFVADAEGGDVHEFVSWGIEFTPIPEAGPERLLFVGLIAVKWLCPKCRARGAWRGR